MAEIFTEGFFTGNASGLTNIPGGNITGIGSVAGSFNASVSGSVGVPTTLLLTNTTGATISGTLHVLMDVIANAGGTVTGTVNYTNDSGSWSEALPNAASSAAIGPIPTIPFDLSVANNQSVTFAITSTANPLLKVKLWFVREM